MIASRGVLLRSWAPWRSAPVPAPRKLLASHRRRRVAADQPGASAILSPDGTTLAFVARQAGPTRLFIRKLDQLQAAPLAGTEGAENPFFSPDGQWLAFFAGGTLKKISVTGGAAVTLCDAPQGRGGTWADDDTILFTPTGAPNATLMRVSAAGGTPAAFGALSPGADEAAVAAGAAGRSGGAVQRALVAATTGTRPTSSSPRCRAGPRRWSSAAGTTAATCRAAHLIYLHQGTLFAVPFDLTRLETVGPAVPALEGVAAIPTTGGAQLAVSSEGTLVYVPGTAVSAARPIDWLTRDGKTAVLRAANADWANPRFSPDGQKLALDISDGKQRDIWVYDWARDTLTQLTFDPGDDRFPVWTPDGRRLVFASDRAKAGTSNLYWVNADGTGEVTRLTDSPEYQVPRSSWHPSGRFLAFHAGRRATGNDLMILPMEGDATRGWTPGTPTVFLSTPANETTPMFSPDGRWIAYTSNEAGGASDVYVRPFPGPGGQWRISTAGGRYPRWSATAPELLFVERSRHDHGRAVRRRRRLVPRRHAADLVADEHSGCDSRRTPRTICIRTASGSRPPRSSEQRRRRQDQVVFVFNFGDYLRTIAPGNKVVSLMPGTRLGPYEILSKQGALGLAGCLTRSRQAGRSTRMEVNPCR